MRENGCRITVQLLLDTSEKIRKGEFVSMDNVSSSAVLLLKNGTGNGDVSVDARKSLSGCDDEEKSGDDEVDSDFTGSEDSSRVLKANR